MGLVSRDCTGIERDSFQLSLACTAACPSQQYSTSSILRCNSAACTVCINVISKSEQVAAVNIIRSVNYTVYRSHCCISVSLLCMIIAVHRMLPVFIVAMLNSKVKHVSTLFLHRHSSFRWWSDSWLKELPAAWTSSLFMSQRSSGSQDSMVGTRMTHGYVFVLALQHALLLSLCSWEDRGQWKF